MFQENVKTVFLFGQQLEYHLFKIAIEFAELGLNVWFISPHQFNKLPEGIACPEKEILKLITFLYIQDYTELLRQTNNIHSWHKIPNVIICNHYNQYINLLSETTHMAAFVTSSLLDAADTCANKHKKKTHLIVSHHDVNESQVPVLQTVIDLYFNMVVEATAEELDLSLIL